MDKGIAIDEIVPFVSRMVFAMSRLLGYVDELGRQVDEASPRSRSAGLDDRIKEALADIPLESPTPQPAERPVHMVGTAVWPTGAAQVHNSNGPSDPSSEGEGSRVEPVLEGAVVLRFTPVHTAGDMAWVNKALATMPGIDTLCQIEAGPSPGTLDVSVSLKEPVALFQLAESGFDTSVIEDGVVQIVAAGRRKAE